MTQLCPCCKRPFPPKLKIGIGKVRRRIVDYILDNPNGVTTRQILDHVYADDPNGGPDSTSAVSALIYFVNKEIRSQGYEIKATGGPGSTYSLRQIKPKNLQDAARILSKETYVDV